MSQIVAVAVLFLYVSIGLGVAAAGLEMKRYPKSAVEIAGAVVIWPMFLVGEILVTVMRYGDSLKGHQ